MIKGDGDKFFNNQTNVQRELERLRQGSWGQMMHVIIVKKYIDLIHER